MMVAHEKSLSQTTLIWSCLDRAKKARDGGPMSASDALSDFSSEDTLGQNASVKPSAETGMVTLAEVVASNVPLKWYEAVAIVQETCDVAAASAFGVHIPELAGIEITERGSVRVQPGNPQGDAVRRAAHTLGALLTDPDLPVKLRLLIEVTSSSPQYLSLSELSKDLQPFERPRRAQQIGIAYQRWRTAMNRPAPSKTTAEKPAPSTEVADNEVPKDVGNDRARKRLQGVVVGSAAAVLAAAIGAAALWLTGASPRLPSQAAPSVLEQALEATNIGLAWTVDRLGLAGDGLDTPAESPSEPTPPSAARPGVPRANAARSSSARLVDVALPRETEAPEPASAPRVAAVASLADAVLAPTSVVYTSADPHVQPPVAIRPQMPPTDHLDPSHADVASMDILVSPTGLVEHVRLGPGPSRMSHVMLLSAAKTWQFQPAMRDGHPVPYRLKQLWLVTR